MFLGYEYTITRILLESNTPDSDTIAKVGLKEG